MKEILDDNASSDESEIVRSECETEASEENNGERRKTAECRFEELFAKYGESKESGSESEMVYTTQSLKKME